MDNENLYQLTFNTSGTASAVLTNNDTVDKVYVEERFTNMKDNIPLISLKEIADEKCVSHIITFGTLGAKSVVRDGGRVMGWSYGEADRIAKMIPNELGITLTSARKKNPELT